MNQLVNVVPNSNVTSVTQAMVSAVRQNGTVHTQSIGAESVDRMLKAARDAERQLAQDDIAVKFFTSRNTVLIDGHNHSAVHLTISARDDENEDGLEISAEDLRSVMEDRPAVTLDNNALLDKLREHNAESPTLSGGDVDAAWDDAEVGDETVGGTAPTPDQDVVEELGEAVGLTYEDDEPLNTAEKLEERDEERWELDPASAEDNA